LSARWLLLAWLEEHPTKKSLLAAAQAKSRKAGKPPPAPIAPEPE
jgi:hypothetical protein